MQGLEMSFKIKYLKDYISIKVNLPFDKQVGKININFIYFPEESLLYIDEDKSKFIPTINKSQVYTNIMKDIYTKIEQDNINKDFFDKKAQTEIKQIIEGDK